MSRALSDEEAADRLARASAALGEEPGASVQADTALTAARRSLTILMLGLEQAGEGASHTVTPASPP